MTRKHLIIISALLGAVLLFVLARNPQNTINGRWEKSDDKVFYDTVEFFSDGTFVTRVSSWCGTYTLDGSRLRLTGMMNSDVFTVEISKNGNQLTLTNSLGYSTTYSRAN